MLLTVKWFVLWVLRVGTLYVTFPYVEWLNEDITMFIGYEKSRHWHFGEGCGWTRMRAYHRKCVACHSWLKAKLTYNFERGLHVEWRVDRKPYKHGNVGKFYYTKKILWYSVFVHWMRKSLFIMYGPNALKQWWGYWFKGKRWKCNTWMVYIRTHLSHCWLEINRKGRSACYLGFDKRYWHVMFFVYGLHWIRCF